MADPEPAAVGAQGAPAPHEAAVGAAGHAAYAGPVVQVEVALLLERYDRDENNERGHVHLRVCRGVTAVGAAGAAAEPAVANGDDVGRDNTVRLYARPLSKLISLFRLPEDQAESRARSLVSPDLIAAFREPVPRELQPLTREALPALPARGADAYEHSNRQLGLSAAGIVCLLRRQIWDLIFDPITALETAFDILSDSAQVIAAPASSLVACLHRAGVETIALEPSLAKRVGYRNAVVSSSLIRCFSPIENATVVAALDDARIAAKQELARRAEPECVLCPSVSLALSVISLCSLDVWTHCIHAALTLCFCFLQTCVCWTGCWRWCWCCWSRACLST